MPRRLSRADRRAAFLEVAGRIVEEGGATALTFDSLASRAEVAPSLPYAYFASRDEVLVELFEVIVGDIDAAVAAVVDRGGPTEVVLGRGLEVWFDAVRDHGRLVGALLDGRAVPGLDAAVHRRDRVSHELWRTFAADRWALGGAEAHLVAATINSAATATVQLWVRRRGTRAGLVDGYVRAMVGAASALAT